MPKMENLKYSSSSTSSPEGLARNWSQTVLTAKSLDFVQLMSIPSKRNSRAVVVRKMVFGLSNMCGMALFIMFNAPGFVCMVNVAIAWKKWLVSEMLFFLIFLSVKYTYP